MELDKNGPESGPRLSVSSLILYLFITVIVLFGGNAAVDWTVDSLAGSCLRINSDADLCLVPSGPP